MSLASIQIVELTGMDDSDYDCDLIRCDSMLIIGDLSGAM